MTHARHPNDVNWFRTEPRPIQPMLPEVIRDALDDPESESGYEVARQALVDLAALVCAADAAVSEIHDAIYAEPFDRHVASDAVWHAHNILRSA